MEPRPHSPPIEALVAGMIACRTNAEDLLFEANLLAQSDRCARAYALLHTACEELGKFSVLELAARRLLRDNPPQWKRFWQRFRSHDSKSAQLEVQLMLLASSSDETDEIPEVAATLFSRGLRVRNAALYVDVASDGSFQKPSDIDFSIPLPALRAVAAHALNGAKKRGNAPTEIGQFLTEPLPARAVLDLVGRGLERAREAGISKGRILDLLAKQFR